MKKICKLMLIAAVIIAASVSSIAGDLVFDVCQGYYLLTKILQKSGIQKNEVIELIYRGFI